MDDQLLRHPAAHPSGGAVDAGPRRWSRRDDQHAWRSQRVQRTTAPTRRRRRRWPPITKTLALELGPSGIRVNGIHPGYIWGESVEWYFNELATERGVTPQEVYDEIAGETALKYLPVVEEIAGAVLFFATDLSKCVTGQSLAVNSGHLMIHGRQVGHTCGHRCGQLTRWLPS